MKTRSSADIGYLSPSERDAVRGFLDKLRAVPALGFRKAVLFGSRAIGMGWEESDIDILVLLAEVTIERKHAVWDLAHGIFLDTDIDISPLVMSTAAFRKLVDHERLIAKKIEREGIPL